MKRWTTGGAAKRFASGPRQANALHPRRGTAMPPTPLGGVAIPADTDRRTYLADWLTAPDNPFFARNLVNRFWGYLMGRGLVEPLDDMRATNPASNPTALMSLVETGNSWVDANFKETQIKKFVPGQQADIELDAYPDIKIKGTLESVSDATGAKFSLLPPDNASGNFVKVVQRLPVKIEFNNNDAFVKQLKAGMNVSVDVHL